MFSSRCLTRQIFDPVGTVQPMDRGFQHERHGSRDAKPSSVGYNNVWSDTASSLYAFMMMC